MLGGIGFLFVSLEDCLEVLPAIKDALDQHPVGCNDKGDGNSPLEADRAQSRHEIIALRAAFWESPQTVATIQDARNVAVGDGVTRLGFDMTVEPINVTLSQRCEDNIHNLSDRPGGASGLYAL